MPQRSSESENAHPLALRDQKENSPASFQELDKENIREAAISIFEQYFGEKVR